MQKLARTTAGIAAGVLVGTLGFGIAAAAPGDDVPAAPDVCVDGAAGANAGGNACVPSGPEDIPEELELCGQVGDTAECLVLPPADGGGDPGGPALPDLPVPTDPGDLPIPTDPGDLPIPTDPGELGLPSDPGDLPIPTDPGDGGVSITICGTLEIAGQSGGECITLPPA